MANCSQLTPLPFKVLKPLLLKLEPRLTQIPEFLLRTHALITECSRKRMVEADTLSTKC